MLLISLWTGLVVWLVVERGRVGGINAYLVYGVISPRYFELLIVLKIV